MRVRLAVIVVGLGLFPFAPSANANRNLECYGLPEIFGGPVTAFHDGKEGKLAIGPVLRRIPGISVDDGAEKQTVTQTALNGMKVTAELRYSDGKLVTASREYRRGNEKLAGKEFYYDWKKSACRPKRILVKDLSQLGGDTTGVLFDADICQALKDNGVRPRNSAACVDDAKKVMDVLQAFDDKLRAATDGKEEVVVTNAFTPNALVPLKSIAHPVTGKSIDSSVALALMASCADYARIGEGVVPIRGADERKGDDVSSQGAN